MKPKSFRNYCGVDAENAGYEPDGMFDFSGGGNLTEDADGYDELQEFLSDEDDVNFSADGTPADIVNDPIGTKYKVVEDGLQNLYGNKIRKNFLFTKETEIKKFIKIISTFPDVNGRWSGKFSLFTLSIDELQPYVKNDLSNINTGDIIIVDKNPFNISVDNVNKIDSVFDGFKTSKTRNDSIIKYSPILNSKLEKVVYGNSSSGMPPINNRRPPINNPEYAMSMDEQEKILKDVPLGDYIVNVKYIRSYPVDATNSKKSTQFFKGDTISVVDKKMLPASGWLKGGFLVLSNGELVSLYNYNKKYIQKK